MIEFHHSCRAQEDWWQSIIINPAYQTCFFIKLLVSSLAHSWRVFHRNYKNSHFSLSVSPSHLSLRHTLFGPLLNQRLTQAPSNLLCPVLFTSRLPARFMGAVHSGWKAFSASLQWYTKRPLVYHSIITLLANLVIWCALCTFETMPLFQRP